MNMDLVRIKLPDGTIGTIPRENLEKAISQYGATQVTSGSQPKTFGSRVLGTAEDVVMAPIRLVETGYGAGKQLFTQSPLQSAKDVGYGLGVPLEKLAGLAVSPFSKRISQKYFTPSNYAEQRASTPLGEVAAFAPALSGAGAVESAVTEGLGGVLPSLAARGAGLAAGGATAAGLTGQPIESGAIQNVLIGGLIGAAGKGIGKVLPKIIGGTGKSGKLTAQELAQRQASVPEGVSVPLGELAQSPSLKMLQKALRLVPFSGMTKPETEAFEYGMRTKNEMVPEIAQNETKPYLNTIANDYLNSYDLQKAKTNAAYEDIKNYLKNTNTKIDDSPIMNSLNSVNSQLSKESETQLGSDLYNDFKNKILNDYLSSKDKPYRINLKNPDNLFRFRRQLNNYISELDPAKERTLSRYTSLLKKGIDESLENTAETDPILKKLHDNANSERITQGKFENIPDDVLGRSSKKFTDFYKSLKTANKDIGSAIEGYLTPTKDNRMLSHLMENISPASRELATGVALNHKSLGGLIKKMEKFQKPDLKTLLGNKYSLADSLMNLKEIYPQFKNPEFLPDTGALGEKVRKGLEIGALPAAVIGGAVSPSLALGTLGALPLSRGVSSFLRSPKSAQMYARSLEGLPLTRGNIERVLRGTVVASPKNNEE